MFIYLLHSFLLPLLPSSYTSKSLKLIILSMWLFLFFHSFREMMGMNKERSTISIFSFVSMILLVLYFFLLGMMIKTIFLRDEQTFIKLEYINNMQKFTQFFLFFVIFSSIYLYMYFGMDIETVNTMYHSIVGLLFTFFLLYLGLNFRYLGQNHLLQKERFVQLSRIGIFMVFLFQLCLIPLNKIIPTFVLLFVTFFFFNLQLYKYFTNGVMFFPLFNKYNNMGLRHYYL